MTSPLPPAGRIGARIAAVATHLPATRLTNEQLEAELHAWPAAKILDKTGIAERRVAGADETAADLGVAACERLFAGGVAREAVDFLILCTQAPDHILPTSACIMQHKLGLPRRVGALDVNLGCSGFVYGLSLAAGLIAGGLAGNVLLVTADTYSKYIHPRDRSVRTLFGDGAAATLVTADADATLGPFEFGTDGAGASRLIVPAGGYRLPRDAETARESEDRSGNIRSQEHLFMDGAAVMSFTLDVVPRTMAALLERTGRGVAEFDQVVLHQANKFMLDTLQRRLGLPDEQVPRRYAECGNTVSSTIPFVLEALLATGQVARGTRSMLIGFGVGLSWAGAVVEW